MKYIQTKFIRKYFHVFAPGLSFPLIIALTMPVLLACSPAQAQNAAVPSPAPAATAPPTAPLSAEQAQRALDVLQDDSKRTQLIDVLRAIAVAAPQGKAPAPTAPNSSATGSPATTPPATSAAAQPPAAPVESDNLGAQLLVQISDWLGELSSEVSVIASAPTHLPLVWKWMVRTVNDPFALGMLIDAAWKLLLVLACALAVEWLVGRILLRPLATVDSYAPVRAERREERHAAREEKKIEQDTQATRAEKQDAGERAEARRRQISVANAGRWMLRLPFVIVRLILDLLPVIAFATIGNLLLATQLGAVETPRVLILAIVNAYVLCRTLMCVVRAAVSPTGNRLSLFAIRGETAAYIEIWARRIVTVAVFGVALANVALLLGLYRPAYHAVLKLVMLIVHLFIVVMILQSRRMIAGMIRAPKWRHGVIALLRNRLADVWHYLAIFVDLALWFIWALRIRNGYSLLLQYILATAAVVAVARLVSIVVLSALDRVFRINPEFIRRFPGLETRANRYYPMLRGTVSVLIALTAAVALLEVWGVNALVWFYSGQIGGRLLSSLLTIAIAMLIALIIWEASNAGIERHLSKLSREGRYGRAARLRTFLPMLRTTLLCIILTIVALTALSELGVNIAPLLAGAGIVGIAVGFGSQKLVQDLITGLFLLLENALQVGDVVTVSGLTGKVENLSIRTIRLRASDGSVHIVPFSSVTNLTNTNRGIGNASISVNVAYKEDTDRVSAVLKEIAAEMRQDPAFANRMRGDLDLWGVDKVDATMATIVGQIECTDSGRWPVQREFYRRMKRRFQELGIEIASPGSTNIFLQQPESEAESGSPKPKEA